MSPGKCPKCRGNMTTKRIKKVNPSNCPTCGGKRFQLLPCRRRSKDRIWLRCPNCIQTLSYLSYPKEKLDKAK